MLQTSDFGLKKGRFKMNEKGQSLKHEVNKEKSHRYSQINILSCIYTNNTDRLRKLKTLKPIKVH